MTTLVIQEWPIKRQTDQSTLVQRCLKACGFNLDEVIFEYAVPHTVTSGKPSDADMAVAGRNVARILAQHKPQKVLLMGPASLAAVYKQNKLGNIFKERGRAIKLKLADDLFGVAIPTFSAYQVMKEPDSFRDLVADISKLARIDAPMEPPTVWYTICDDPEELRSALCRLSKASFISCDLETSGLRVKEHEIEAIGFGALYPELDGGEVVIIPWHLVKNEVVRYCVKDFFRDYFGPVVFHNAKFDLQFLAEWLKMRTPVRNVADTLLMNYVLDERPIADRLSPHGLKTIARVRYDLTDYKFDFEAFWSKPADQRDWGPLYTYLGVDLWCTARLYYDLRQELEEEPASLRQVLDTLLFPATIALADIERNGTLIDVGYLTDYGMQIRDEIEDVLEDIRNLVELASFNPGSPKQLAEVFYDKLGIPYPSRTTDKDMLAWVQTEMPNTPAADLAGLVEDFRGRKKILGTYVDGLLALTDLTNSVHASFNLAGTSTGRLSCNDPALQTIPQMAGPAIRRAFVPPPGYVWMKADYSQLELRVAAYLSQDSNMIQAFIDERDIHSEVAAAMFQIDPNDVSKKQRYAAKFVDFGVLYGRGAFSIAYGRELRQYHWTEQMAQEFIDNYLNEFSRLRDWMAGQRRDVLSKQELSTPLGRIRRWPFIHQSTRGEAQRQALNFPIQSTASDITLNALIHLHSELLARELLTRIVITVHDEIDLVVKIEELPEVVDLVYNCMENRLPLDINVPIKAEIEIGPNWADVSPVQETQWYWHSESDSWVPAWDVNDQHAHIELTGPCSYDEMSKRTQIRSSQKQ